LEAGDEQHRVCVHANGAGNAGIPHMNFAEAAPTKLLYVDEFEMGRTTQADQEESKAISDAVQD